MGDPFGKQFAEIIQARRREAGDFYRAITSETVSEDAARVMRQALAGMLWSKQYFGFDVDKWLEEHSADPLRLGSHQIRNSEWFHMMSEHIISMPDKWEYPWYAAWDLAFHTLALSAVDLDFAKEQLDLLLKKLLPSPQWSDSGIRMELRGCKSARARLGGALPIPHRTDYARPRRH
jgi:hypothetical protein